VVLAHLSEENNSPELVTVACEAAIEERGLRHFQLSIAEQNHPTPIFVI
jgi:hypothetical protein